MKFSNSILLNYLLALTAILLVVAPAPSHSQPNFPYSRYALGNYEEPLLSAPSLMGGISIAYRHRLFLNPANPASYSAIAVNAPSSTKSPFAKTAMEFGFEGIRSFLKTADSTYKSGDMRPQYLFFGFPVRKGWAIAAGLVPFSFMDYRFSRVNTIDNSGGYFEQYEGSGTIYRFIAGTGYEYKGFSAGINSGFLFGKLEHQHIIAFADSLDAFNTRLTNTLKPKGIFWDIGIQYHHTLKNGMFTGIGVISGFSTNTRAETDETWDRFEYSPLGPIIIKDTIRASIQQSANITLPWSIGVGLISGKENNWLMSAEFKWFAWSKYDNPFDDDILQDAWTLRIGGEYVPDQAGKYLNRVHFRMGFHYTSGYLKLKNQDINDYGITFGVALPAKAGDVRITEPYINLGLEAGGRGTTDNDLIKVNFVKLHLAFTLNSKWFTKQKFE